MTVAAQLNWLVAGIDGEIAWHPGNGDDRLIRPEIVGIGSDAGEVKYGWIHGRPRSGGLNSSIHGSPDCQRPPLSLEEVIFSSDAMDVIAG